MDFPAASPSQVLLSSLPFCNRELCFFTLSRRAIIESASLSEAPARQIAASWVLSSLAGFRLPVMHLGQSLSAFTGLGRHIQDGIFAVQEFADDVNPDDFRNGPPSDQHIIPAQCQSTPAPVASDKARASRPKNSR